MNRIQVAIGNLDNVSVNAQMLEQDNRLHSGDTLWFKGELQRHLAMMTGLVGRANQENMQLRSYCQHMGSMLAQCLGHQAHYAPDPGVLSCAHLVRTMTAPLWILMCKERNYDVAAGHAQDTETLTQALPAIGINTQPVKQLALSDDWKCLLTWGKKNSCGITVWLTSVYMD
jgi:hypothetical protein